MTNVYSHIGYWIHIRRDLIFLLRWNRLSNLPLCNNLWIIQDERYDISW